MRVILGGKMEREKSLFYKLKLLVLREVTAIISIGSFLSVVINTFNRRPISNIIAPFVLGIITLTLHIFTRKSKSVEGIRLGLMIFLCNIYIPLGWYTSPGSTSAFPYYTLGILFICAFLIEKKKELLITAISVVQIQLLLWYETVHPAKFYTYDDIVYRSFDLGINITAVIIIIVYILHKITMTSLKRDEELRIMSITDQLTNLYNRRYIINKLEEIYNVSQKTKEEFSLAILDLNKFKFINDTYGHLVGDKVLVAVGNLLKSLNGDDLLIGRYGGDEFMLIFKNTTYTETKEFIEELKKKFKYLERDFKGINLEFSIGLCSNQKNTLEEMIHYADRHLYIDKERS